MEGEVHVCHYCKTWFRLNTFVSLFLSFLSFFSPRSFQGVSIAGYHNLLNAVLVHTYPEDGSYIRLRPSRAHRRPSCPPSPLSSAY